MPAPYPFASVEVTGTAATATTATLAAAAGVRRGVQAVTVSCSGAASGPITLSIVDGATTIWETDLTLALEVPQSPLQAPVVGAAGNAVAVTASAGAASCVVKLDVEYFDLIPGNTPPA